MRMFDTACLSLCVALFFPGPARAEEFTLTSGEMTEGGTMARQQADNAPGCKGANISPSLSWKGAPAGTKSFAIMMSDRDAPSKRVH